MQAKYTALLESLPSMLNNYLFWYVIVTSHFILSYIWVWH